MIYGRLIFAEGIFDFSIRSIELKNYAMKYLKRK